MIPYPDPPCDCLETENCWCDPCTPWETRQRHAFYLEDVAKRAEEWLRSGHRVSAGSLFTEKMLTDYLELRPTSPVELGMKHGRPKTYRPGEEDAYD